MQYSTELVINLPRERVIELFDNPDNLPKWQPGFVSLEHMSGEPGKPGGKYRLFYKMGGREVEMIETIETRSLPDEFTATYEAKGVWNWLSNHFYEESSGKTRWKQETEFRFSGLMKIFSFFMRGSFPKQTLENMEDFKRFAEGQT